MADLGFDVMRRTPASAGSELIAGDHAPSTSAGRSPSLLAVAARAVDQDCA
jgi:hypothetical protein